MPVYGARNLNIDFLRKLSILTHGQLNFVLPSFNMLKFLKIVKNITDIPLLYSADTSLYIKMHIINKLIRNNKICIELKLIS